METLPTHPMLTNSCPAHHQAVPNNCLCLRLSKSGSGAEELQYKMLVSRSKPWGQYTNLQLTTTSDRQSSLWYTDVSFHLIPVHKIMPNTFKKCSQAFPTFLPFHMDLILCCSAQAKNFHHKREYMKFFISLVLKVCLQSTNLRRKQPKCLYKNTIQFFLKTPKLHKKSTTSCLY